MASDVRVQLLLRAAWRSAEGVERVQRILESLGLEPSGSGRVTVSARADAETFRKVFGRRPGRGAGGRTEEPAIEVPSALRELVESVTIAPPHILMDHPPHERDTQ